MTKHTYSGKYTTIKIPEGCTQMIDKMLVSGLGYTSRTDVIKTAVRQKYEQYNDLKALSPDEKPTSRNRVTANERRIKKAVSQ